MKALQSALRASTAAHRTGLRSGLCLGASGLWPGLGFQLGAESTDVVLLVMNTRGVNALLDSKVKLGANVSVAAGPKGRSVEASTDASMRAEILSYSRSRGLFAGVSLEGASLRPDDDPPRWSTDARSPRAGS